MGIPNDTKVEKYMSSLGTILITGSNRGIGLEFVKQYSSRNWDVIATCRNTSQAEELIELSKNHDNLDLMNLAGFCRNCLSKWYREEADKKGITISDPEAREHVYGMPYTEWKDKYQK